MVERGSKNLVSEWCGVGQSGTVKKSFSVFLVYVSAGQFFPYYKRILPSLDCWDSKSRL